MAADDPQTVSEALERFGPPRSSTTEPDGEMFIRWTIRAAGPPGSAEDIRVRATRSGLVTRFQRQALQLAADHDFDRDKRRAERRDERTRRI